MKRHSSPPWSCAQKPRGDRPVAAGKEPAEISRVVEAERIGDRRDRQVGVDEIAPRLADDPLEDRMRRRISGRRALRRLRCVGVTGKADA